ncbi:MAG: hypothetical protein NVSMB51_19050 [Solirubrobacteraceae bacterium]
MMDTPRRRRVTSLLVAFCAAMLLAACGGGSSSGGGSGSGDASSILAQTFGAHQSLHSGRLSTSIEANLKGLKSFTAPLSIKLDGPFQGHGPKALPEFGFTLLIAASGQNFSAGLTSTSGKAWLQFAGTNYLIPDSVFSQFRASYLQSAAKNTSTGSTLSKFGIDPRSWLSNPRKVGNEQVGGTDTQHVTAGLNTTKLLSDFNTLLGKAGSVSGAAAAAPRSISPATQAAFSRSVKSATVDVYSGASDHALRRLKLAVQLDVASADRAQLRGFQGGMIGFDLTIGELNAPQSIKAPASAKPLSGLLSGGLSGALGGGAAAGATGATGASGSGSVNAPQAYLDCVSRAKSDVAAIQKCSSLINAGH